ncbi:Ig-like domain-containing protein [Variovorax sp. J22R133]|uniref:Ig-like domain-containing protein n=1 Tax=Variovorax brevis TaxID=3053503 RepID=UPI0025751855|nr:Ig-like domain-containing protein [Variovorax sp. J22R133]MDM0115511.1 Ig-like domain-containing protein [Variovorax sp. J22R133]
MINNGKAAKAVELDGNSVVKLKASPGFKYILNSEGDVAPENVTITRVGDDLQLTLEGIGEAPVDDNGDWTFTPTTPLPEGPHAITTQEKDPAGNPGPVSPPLDIVVDTTAPEAPTSLVATDDVGAKTGPVADGDTTDDNKPTFSGKGEPGSTVTVYDNGVKLGDAPVDLKGNWSLTPTTPLADGPHAFTTTTKDPAGNTSPVSAPLNVVIDTAAPAAPTTLVATDDVGAKTGQLANGDVTDDNKPALSGKAEPGSTVTVYDNGTKLGTAPVDANGNWTLTPTTPLADGPHAFTATATDPAGNTSPATAPLNVTVDTAAPVAPAITKGIDNEGFVTGNLANGATTDDTTPALVGTAEPGSTVTIYDDGKPLGTVTAGPDGQWSYTPTTPLKQGEHDFTVTATDSVGHDSPASAPYTLTVDTKEVATIKSISTDYGVKGDFNTHDTSLTINGDLTKALNADQKVQISIDGGKTWSNVNAAAGATEWSYVDPRTLTDGSYEYQARVVDTAGTVVGPATSQEVIIDTTPPTTTITIDAITNDTGTPGDFVTADKSITISGTISAPLADDERVQISLEGSNTWTVVDVPAGATTWSYVDTRSLEVGEHVYEVRVANVRPGVTGDHDTQVVTIEDRPATPIGLDLNDDGQIGVTGATSSSQKDAGAAMGHTVQFDIDADGQKDTIEWFDGSGDGILIDNRDGHAAEHMDGSRLFGDQGGNYSDGYAKLSLLDVNGDGQLAGSELDGIELWVDNGDAVVQAGEIQTLAQHGVAAIGTNAHLVEDEHGKQHLQSTATRDDGMLIMSEDVFFLQDHSATAKPAQAGQQEPVAPVAVDCPTYEAHTTVSSTSQLLVDDKVHTTIL